MEVPSDDRFSDLPQSVIHQIFSYLEKNDIPRLSGVSRKFRELCNSCPNLDLEADFLTSQKCESKCRGFRDFVNRVVSQRNGVGIHRLRLWWFCDRSHYKQAGPLFDDWIKYAVECNVQEIDLGLFPGDGELFVIPPCLSSCQSLRDLKINLKDQGLVLQPGSFSSLVDLTLRNVELCATFSGGAIGHWISTFCKSLKNLCLDNILCSRSKDMSISSSSLQQLTIQGCKFPEASNLSITSASLQHLTMSSCLFNERANVDVRAERLETLTVDVVLTSQFPSLEYEHFKFIIFAPSLLVFNWTGTPVSYSDNLEHFWCLDEASLSLDFHLNNGDKEFIRDFLERLLHSVRYTRMLQVNTEIFTYYDQPGVFDNLKHLVVVVRRFEEDQDQTISQFISGLQNLRTLTIKLDDCDNAVIDTNVVALLWLRAESYGTKYRKPCKLALSFCEEEEKIDTDRKGTVGLLKWILEYGKALEEVTFYY